ncbi:Pyridoxal phosphate (PLP)-dependent transferase superfamily protein [Forsythia ovata]|uniref:Pyridoxal phosphate (PLP)-dependent transferase superfamily protein n=1 Tax=Forsythia ovata TaxID=205694 RepID=A0ABD1QM59_9LAMI
MDSFGLSLFQPDFIITSFYRVFGYDLTGFGCLLIKKSVMEAYIISRGMLVLVRDVFETDIEHDNSSDRDGTSTIFEETESISIGEVMKSPVFSEDKSSDNSLWIDLGQSPLGSKNAGHPSKHKANSPSPPVWFSGQKNNRRTSPNLSDVLVEEI